MKIITKEQFLRLTEVERCRILVKICKGQVFYKGEWFDENYKRNKTIKFWWY